MPRYKYLDFFNAFHTLGFHGLFIEGVFVGPYFKLHTYDNGFP